MPRKPFCQFCRKDDGSFDYDEHHAILCGIGDGLRPCKSEKSWELHSDEWHYYLVARGVTFALFVILLIEIVK